MELWAPMILINGVITTINGLISGFPLGFKPLYISEVVGSYLQLLRASLLVRHISHRVVVTPRRQRSIEVAVHPTVANLAEEVGMINPLGQPPVGGGKCLKLLLGDGFKYFLFHPCLGKIPTSTSIFFKGVGSTTN